MKRLLIIILVMAGILALGCPSEPDPPITVSSPNWQFMGGNCEIDITDFSIKKDFQYEVSLKVEVDEWIWNQGLTGTLYGVPEGETEEGRLSSGIRPSPGSFQEGINEYSWVFKAWDNAEPLERQYFLIEIRNLAPTSVYGMKGSFVADEVDSFWDDFEYMGLIDTVGTTAGGMNAQIGRGNIEGAELSKLESAKPGSYLEFTIEGCTASWKTSLDPGEEQATWGKIGLTSSSGGEYPCVVPDGYVAVGRFKCRISIDDILSRVIRPANQSPYLFVNPYNGSIITKCVLWEKK